jgi:hypothetical protein
VSRRAAGHYPARKLGGPHLQLAAIRVAALATNIDAGWRQ